jgi:histidinol-phosphate aminotransferase
MNADKTPPVRDDLAGVQGYVSPQLPAKHRMNTNESPFPPPASLIDEVTGMLRSLELNRYPERDADALHEALASATGHQREGLWIANGSNEVLLHLLLGFGGPGRVALTFEPTYQLHSLISRISGTQVRNGTRRPGSWQVNAPARFEADIVFFCHPNNPTGVLEDASLIGAAAQEASLVIVDEAYIEFAATGSSVAPLVERYRNLVIVRTFSKAWSLAGVRLGYLMASPDLVADLKKVRLPYHLSSFAQAAGIAALGHREESTRSVEEIVTQREALQRELSSMGLRTYDSSANFVLFEVPNAQAVWQGLYDRGILVRNYPSNPMLVDHLRVTATTPDEGEAFLTALKELI